MILTYNREIREKGKGGRVEVVHDLVQGNVRGSKFPFPFSVIYDGYLTGDPKEIPSSRIETDVQS